LTTFFFKNPAQNKYLSVKVLDNYCSYIITEKSPKPIQTLQ
jgi:hypothetical protein